MLNSLQKVYFYFKLSDFKWLALLKKMARKNAGLEKSKTKKRKKKEKGKKKGKESERQKNRRNRRPRKKCF